MMVEQQTYGNSMKHEEKLVTPEWAHEILTEHQRRVQHGEFAQRLISEKTVKRYAGDMKAGQWKLSPHGIVFDKNDNLVDGQHRLEAVRLAKVPVKMIIVTGVEPSDNGKPGVIDVIDVVRPRTIDQMLHMHGLVSARNYMSSIRCMCMVAHARANVLMTYPQCFHLLYEKDLKNNIDRVLATTTHTRDFQSRFVGPLAYYHTARPKKAVDFADGFFNLTADKSSAVSALLRWEKNRAAHRVRSELSIRAVASALRTWDLNEPIEYIKPTVEAVEWLSNLNPNLRDSIRKLVPSN